tara:strand:- start:510 stop:665 length:156 start_codon:yes stop_codon:yes gene_type:complete
MEENFVLPGVVTAGNVIFAEKYIQIGQNHLGIKKHKFMIIILIKLKFVFLT